MNLIKVLLGNLASTQLYAVSQGDYSYPGFEPLPNHVKKIIETCEILLFPLLPGVSTILSIRGSDERQPRGEAKNVTSMLSLKIFTC